MPNARAAGPGGEGEPGAPPSASLEPLPVPRAELRTRAVDAAVRLTGCPWRAYGRDAGGLDQFGLLSEVYFGAIGRIRDFGRAYPAPEGRGMIAPAAGALAALATWRGLSRIAPAAAQSGDMIALASPDLSPCFVLGVLVSPVRNGPGALLTIAPGPGVHVAEFGDGRALRPDRVIGALTWRGLP